MNIKGIAVVVLMLAAAAFMGYFTATHSNKIFAMFSPNEVVYRATPPWYERERGFESISWEMLIPEIERDVLAKYQLKSAVELSDITAQILNSIESANDEQYTRAMISTSTVDAFEGQVVSLSGFIVPIDFYPDKQPKNIFLVPYFGACIHFPPPPPNQIIFVRLESGFANFDMTQAYTLNGRLNIELFEDLLGTSAYSMDVSNIEIFKGEPDTFRNHSL